MDSTDGERIAWPQAQVGSLRKGTALFISIAGLRNVTAPDAQRQSKKKIRAAHAKEKQQIQKRATTRIALT